MNEYKEENPFERIDEPKIGHYMVLVLNDMGRLAFGTHSTFKTFENARRFADTITYRYKPIVVKLEDASK